MFSRTTIVCRLTGLLAGLVLVVGCGQHRGTTVTVPWSVEWNGASVSCNKPQPSGLQLDDARLFVHDVRFVDEGGRETEARLFPDGQWQTNRVALIDFAPDCTSGRSPHARLELQAPPGSYVELRFKLGVPFELNHANAAVAEGPLAVGAMNWSWQGGYKFLKVEGKVNDVPFRVHLGSTECSGTIGHISGCGRPNRADVSVPLTKSGGVALDLNALVHADLKAPSECMGESVAVCEGPYAAMGLSLANGLAVGGQHAFLSR